MGFNSFFQNLKIFSMTDLNKAYTSMLTPYL